MTFVCGGLDKTSKDLTELSPSTLAAVERTFLRGERVVGLVSPVSSDAASTPAVGERRLPLESADAPSSGDDARCCCCFLKSTRTRFMTTRCGGHDGCDRDVITLRSHEQTITIKRLQRETSSNLFVLRCSESLDCLTLA